MQLSVWLFGHRGTRRGAIENTLPAFELALSQGADGVELDVRPCACGELVVLHDPDLLRVAGLNVRVEELPYSAVVAQAPFVPRLDDALDLVLSAHKQVNVEVKSDVMTPEALAERVGARLSARTVAQQRLLLLSSFSVAICEQLARLCPRIPVGYLFKRRACLRPQGIAALHPHYAAIDASLIEEARAGGLRVHAWTVNDPARAQFLAELGVDALISDDLPAIGAAPALMAAHA